MTIIDYIFVFVGLIYFVLAVWFAFVSISEKKRRAAIIAGLFAYALAHVWFGLLILGQSSQIVLVISSMAAVLPAILFFLPVTRPRALQFTDITEKVDERDVMFARAEYTPGTRKYDEYYSMRPEFKEIDDRIRKLPNIMQPGGRFYDPEAARQVEAILSVIAGLARRVDGAINPQQISVKPGTVTKEIKQLVLDLGAGEVGIAALNPMYVYSNVGRGPEEWGSEIENNHRYAIVFTLEMDYSNVEQAPQMPTVEESARQYLRGALISVAVADYIRTLGYPARAHVSDSNYQIMLPPVAQDAGLGEVGRFGYLISKKFGARCRLGGLTTDIPLEIDQPVLLGVQDFCRTCLKCAENCPSSAIPKSDPQNIRGAQKWPIDIARCIKYWRVLGTDCAICMKVCPYSHPPTSLHNLVRSGIKRSPIARKMAIIGDDLLYGRKPS